MYRELRRRPAVRRTHTILATSAAFQAARELVFLGVEQPSGYTEPLLHAWRLRVKAGGRG